MKTILKCRRTFTSLFGIIALTVLGIVAKQDVSAAIAAICMALSGANATQAVFALKGQKPTEGGK